MEEQALILKDSRKIFWWAYAGVSALAALLAYRMASGPVSGVSIIMSATTLIVGLMIPEMMRAGKVCKVTGHKIEVTSGFIQRRHRSLLASTVAEIRVHQTPMQRIFHCGTISISPDTGQEEINLGTFDNPRKAATEIERVLGLHIVKQ